MEAEVLLLRHGPTEWNRLGRIQGRADVPLSPAGRSALTGRSVPVQFRGWQWYASPLVRATETAALLGAGDLRRDPRLIEMHWGEWEGRQLVELRAELGRTMAENEARGLDFEPPGGETPRQVQVRFGAWLAERAEPVIAVTHKGVIRAALALATGWDMKTKPPIKLDYSRAHLFRYDAERGLHLVRHNLALEQGRGSHG